MPAVKQIKTISIIVKYKREKKFVNKRSQIKKSKWENCIAKNTKPVYSNPKPRDIR